MLLNVNLPLLCLVQICQCTNNWWYIISADGALGSDTLILCRFVNWFNSVFIVIWNWHLVHWFYLSWMESNMSILIYLCQFFSVYAFNMSRFMIVNHTKSHFLQPLRSILFRMTFLRVFEDDFLNDSVKGSKGWS